MKTLISIPVLCTCAVFLAQGQALSEIGNNTKTLAQYQKLNAVNKEHRGFVNQFQINNRYLLTDGYLRSNHFAISKLTRNKWNVAAATQSLKWLMSWRSSNRVAKLGESEPGGKMLNLFPYQLIAVTRNGCPVLEVNASNWNVAGFMESQDFNRDAVNSFTDHITQLFEKSLLATKAAFPKCDQVLFIADVMGFTSENSAEPNTLSVAVRVAITLESYYPNLFRKIIFLNANRDVTSILKSLLPFFGTTAKSIHVFTEGEIQEARRYIDKQVDLKQLHFNN